MRLIQGLLDRQGQRDGIWAYNISQKERVLVIPAVLALLGDNPMQSELSCHVGLTGKFFCRCCWVKGRDAADETVQGPAAAESPVSTQTSSSSMAGSTNPSAPGGSDTASIASSARSEPSPSQAAGSSPPKKKGRAQETKQQLVDRATRFLGVRIHFPSLLTTNIHILT